MEEEVVMFSHVDDHKAAVSHTAVCMCVCVVGECREMWWFADSDWCGSMRVTRGTQQSPYFPDTHMYTGPEASTLKSYSIAFITANDSLQNTVNDSSEELCY